MVTGSDGVHRHVEGGGTARGCPVHRWGTTPFYLESWCFMQLAQGSPPPYGGAPPLAVWCTATLLTVTGWEGESSVFP